MAMPRLKQRYLEEVRPALMGRMGYRNIMQAPRLEKICLNMGVGAAREDASLLDQALDHMTQVAGQKAVVTAARKAVSAFKIRRGFKVGCRVTLRGNRMYEFLDRLITVAIPRIRDFRGLDPRSFDGGGNYSFGISEQLIFPEIDPDSVSRPQGMDVTICTTAGTDEEARALLEGFNFPFRRS